MRLGATHCPKVWLLKDQISNQPIQFYILSGKFRCGISLTRDTSAQCQLMSELTDGGSRVRVRSNTAFPSLFTSTHFTALGIVAFHPNKLKEKHECKTIRKLTLYFIHIKLILFWQNDTKYFTTIQSGTFERTKHNTRSRMAHIGRILNEVSNLRCVLRRNSMK